MYVSREDEMEKEGVVVLRWVKIPEEAEETGSKVQLKGLALAV